jgi:hypothetical protein
VLLPAGELFLEVEFGPGTVQGRLAGVFEEGLVEEVRAGPAAMDPVLVLAALLGDRGDAAVLLEGGGGRVTLALGAEGDAEARGQVRTGAGEAGPDLRVGMAKSSSMRAS